MITSKSITFFVLKCLIFYFLLIFPLANMGFLAKSESFFIKSGEVLFSSFMGNGEVRFEKLNAQKKDEKYDLRLALINKDALKAAQLEARKNGKQQDLRAAYVKVSILKSAYIPFAILFALMLATPIGFRRKIRGLLAGIVLVQLYVWFRISIAITYTYQQKDLGVAAMGTVGEAIVGGLHYLFVWNAGMIFIVPVLIWMLVTFRKSDWQGFLTPLSKKSIV